MDPTRKGMKNMLTKQQKSRMYYLHSVLKKKGNTVNGRQRTIKKRAVILSPIEEKYIKELISMNYCVCDDLFNE